MTFWPDFEASEAINRAESDPEQAAKALLIAARYMREGKPLPDYLAEHLASAIEAAMLKPTESRGVELARELNLTAQNRRPAAYWYEVGNWMDGERNPITEDEEPQKLSIEEVAFMAAEHFGISETTAARYYRQYMKEQEAEGLEQAELIIMAGDLYR